MDSIVTILLIIAAVKFVLFGGILYWVFRGDIRSWRAQRRRKPVPTTPACVYCGSKWTHAQPEQESRWEGEELVLVTTYQCQHCEMPFWRVERVAVGRVKR